MSFTISEIYERHEVIPNLRRHMFIVAAVASVICDNFPAPLDKGAVISACLLHDMGNMVKIDFTRYPELNEPEGTAHWQSVKDKYIRKYGGDSDAVTEMILREMGVSGTVLDLVKNIDGFHAAENESSASFERKICNYADMRVSWDKILPLEERMEETRRRYEGKRTSYSHFPGGFSALLRSMRNIETQIFSQCRIRPEEINDTTVAPVVAKLKNFVIK